MNRIVNNLHKTTKIIDKFIFESGTKNCSCLDKLWLSKQFENLNENEIKIIFDKSIELTKNLSLTYLM